MSRRVQKKASQGAADSAVARLLARTLEAADVRVATQNAAARQNERSASSASIFVFRLGEEWLALPASFADEVVPPRTIHSLPHRRDGFLRGLANIGGRLTVCVALESLLQLEIGSRAAHRVLGRRLVVLAEHEHRWAFEADEVHGIHRFDPAALRQLPATVAHASSRFATGLLDVEGRSVGLLDGELVARAVDRRLG
ncbi:chemotaxis protein CheW [Lysobacter terrae]